MKEELKQLNIPEMSISAITDRLGCLYTAAIRAGTPLRDIPTPFLWGPAGIGKSQGVHQLAARIERETGRRTAVTDVRLLLFSPVDLRGIPVADAERRFTNWLMPKIFDMEKGADFVNLLFLDELSAAPQSVQAAAYQICLDRRIGEFALPENCIVIAAGNRTTDGSVAYKMPKALCNRLMHFLVKSDYSAWRAWAVEHGVSDKVIAFLAFRADRLCVTPESSDLAYATPRSWAFVSTLLRNMGDDVSKTRDLIAACIGTDLAIELEAFCRGYASMPPIAEIAAGRCTILPRSHDVMYATVSSLISYLAEQGDALSAGELENACAYASRLPKDFCMSFMQDLLHLPNMNMRLMKCRSFQDWVSKNPHLF